MLKNLLIAVAILIAAPAYVSAQDIFWSFSPTAATSTSNFEVGDTASAYIFSDGPFGFDALEINLTTSNSNVLQFTGGEGFNPTFTGMSSTRFSTATVSIDSETNSGNFFATNIGQNGVNPNLSPFFDPGFNFGVGPNGAVLLARVDFNIIGDGEANLEITLGTSGAIQFPIAVLDPSFGSATLSSTQTISQDMLGDINADGTVDCSDIVPFISVLFTREFLDAADCNQDGEVNFFDISPFIGFLT